MKIFDETDVRDTSKGIQTAAKAAAAWATAHLNALALGAALLLALFVGLGWETPMGGQAGACFAQFEGGQAPHTLWRWNPLVQARVKARYLDLLTRSRAALAPGQPLDLARAAALELAWANACMPRDPQIASLLILAAYYQSVGEPYAPGLGDGMRAVGARCGIRGHDQACLLDALCAVGALDNGQAVLAYDAFGNAFSNVTEALLDETPTARSEDAWGYEQQLTFSEFRFDPNNTAAHLPMVFRNPVFPELERVRLAQWAAVEAWDQGVSASAQTLKTASAQALKSAGAPDVWLSAIAPRLAAVSDAKGKDMDDLRLAIQKALNQPGPGHMDNIVQSRLAPARGKFELNWEGYVAVDPDGSRMPRIEFQRWVRSWASSYKALPPPTVIEPVVENGVSLTPLSGALAVLANDAASDLPVPLWSGVRTRKALEQLGAFDPGGHWDDGQGSRLQARLAAGARLKCRMQERLEAAATPALSKAKSRGRARGRAKAGRRRKGRSRKAAVKPKPADKGVEISVCLVRDGKTGPWVTKFFKDQQLMDAPNWMAAQALQLSGFILPEQDARRLDQPLLKTAADLQEFAGALGGHDFTYGQMAWYERTYQWTRDGFTGQAQWFARLYDRNPSLSMLNYGTINPAYGGSNRWDLYPDLLKQEPWNWQARLDYARHLMYTDQRQKALHQLVGLLEMDPGQVDVLKAMAQDLSEMGFFGEGIQVSDAALSLTARSASTLVFAAEQELDWAWDWRGDGGVDTVSAQGGLFLDLGAIRAKALAQEARTKAPAYAPACAALLRAGMALGDPGSEEDAILKASAQADPGYEPSFQVRAQQLLPKWYGSEDKELAFAKEWAGQLWSLPVSARTALAFGDGDQSKGKAYLAQDTVWREIQDAELGRLKDHPWDVDAAAELGYWAQVAGRQDQSLAALSSGLWRDPGAGAWTDLQTVAFTDGMASGADLPADPAAEAASGIAPQYRRAAFYSKSPNLWTLRARAMQALSARYPENLDFLNDLAGLSWRLKQRASCQWAMQRLGARREDQYWTADEFKQAQQWLSSKQGPETRS